MATFALVFGYIVLIILSFFFAFAAGVGAEQDEIKNKYNCLVCILLYFSFTLLSSFFMRSI